MSFVVVGHCPHCGAPIYSPSSWHGVVPPPATHSCACAPAARFVTVTSTHPTVDNDDTAGTPR